MTDKKFDLTGIGNACMDIVAECDMDFLARHKVHKSHCIYIDYPSLQKLKIELGAYQMVGGGSAANTVYCMQSLGCKSAFLGKIADDTEGRAFRASMEEIGISTHLSVSPNTDEGSTQVISLRTPDGDRSFVTYRGVAEKISADDLDYSVLADSKIAYFDGYTMYSPFALEAFLKSADIARSNDSISVFNPGDLSIVDLHREAVLELIGKVDVVICNLAEARGIFGYDTLQDVAAKFPSVKKTGIVTDGANGAIVFHDGDLVHMPPPRKLQGEIHTLGAGDHFAAGFLYGYTHDFNLHEMARLAELCAANCLSHPEARPLNSLEHLIATALQI